MKLFSFIIVVILFSTSCSNIDHPVDKTKLYSYDYRLFQGTPVWPLAKAAHYEDMASVKKILSASPQLANIPDSVYGNTMLMMAIINQDYDLFKLLIDNGANFNYHNTYDGSSPIIEACSYREYDSKFVKDLVAKGANVNDTTDNAPYAQSSPLMEAAGCGNSSIVEYLIKEGADINYRNNFGATPLGESILTEKYDVALILLNSGADFSSPIYNSVDRHGRLTVSVKLPEALRDAMIDLWTIKYYRKRKLIKFLKTKGIDYDSVPIPDYIIDMAKEQYPSTWKEYLKKY